MLSPLLVTTVSISTLDEKAQALALDVTFNGTQFCYRNFRYDKLSDAMAYARLDALRDNYKSAFRVDPEWLPRPAPSHTEIGLMGRYAISFDGRHYRFAEHRYDRLADALAYAELKAIAS
jgi:hypothetical protein